MHDTRTTPSTARPGARHPLLLLFLLAAVLLTGGYFRFVGLNWDDFADLHPDERFLTRNLLPLVGGGLEFTHDDKRYPPVSIVVNSVSAYTDRSAITPNNGLRVGALKDTPPAEAARWWVGEARVVLYDTVQSALDALLRDEVAALMVSSETAVSLAGAAREIGSLSSPELQQMRCLALNPQTGGAGGYFDTGCSPLNPHHAGAGFYAYGTLPLFIAHFGSQFMQQQEAAGSPLFDFQGGTLVWRFFSALFDCGTIFLIFLIGTRLHNRWVGLLAALLYAAAPLAIQKAHFGTVNSITTFFVTLGLWAAVRVQQHGHWRHFIIFGLSLGAALSGRINTLPLAGVIVLAAMMYAFPVLDTRLPWQERQRLLTRMSLGIIIAGFLTIFAFRLANPYAFQGPQLWNILPNPRFLEDLGSATFGVSGNSDAPPNYQWLNRSAYLYPLKDMLLWGMGIGMAVLAWFGWGWSGYQLVRAKPGGTRNMLLFVWVLVYFGYMGNQWVMTMRYYLPLYPALALLAAWGVVELVRQARQRGEDLLLTRLLLAGFALTLGLLPVYDVVNTGGLTFTAGAAGLVALLLAGGAFMPGLKPNRAVILGSFVALFTVLWGLMFTHLYRTQVTRVQASRWLWENIPGDFALQLDAAPPGTPLINIGIPNNPVDALNPTEELLQSAVRLRPLQPFLVEFVAPAHGTVTRIFAPRLGDDDGDADEETLYFSIARTGDNTPLTTATLTTDLSRSTHLVGEAYTIPLDTPLQVSAGQRYTFKVEALSGTVRSSGSVVVTEGDWDDQLTAIRICELPYDLTLSDGLTPGLVGQDDCRRLEAWYTLITSYDQAMS
ncbi:MAG: glycosyltransferase family 39 protein, partial [Anaerolineae bacterium]|nr:glycosyltransferase family 39 protein [Anaerolineae bacterium]